MLFRINTLACKFYFLASLLRLAFVFGKALNFIPLCTKLLQKVFLKWSKCRVQPEDFWPTMFSSEMENALKYVLWRNMTKRVRPGGLAINVPLVGLDGKNKMLLDFQKVGRPLVVNFGSCTWPEFMADLQKFSRICRVFQQDVDFLLLYIEEAHPTDGWAFEVRPLFGT